MTKELTRRQMMARTGLALGTVVGAGVLQGCSSSVKAADNTPPTADTNPDGGPGTTTDGGGGGTTTGPQVANFPYEQFLPSGYRMDVAAIKEPAYHGYFAGGCCHGAYSALLGHLSSTVGAPFNQLPLDFGKFGGGGIASYGSICGAVLGSVLVTNMVVANANARAAIMTDLMRWYERASLPAYVPASIDAGETGLKLDFSASNIAKLQVIPGSHLCHASVSGWCGANHVSATGNDKKARCARLTADVSGRCAEMINSYLSGGTYAAVAMDANSNYCVGCHTGNSTTAPAVASGMACASCHSDHD